MVAGPVAERMARVAIASAALISIGWALAILASSHTSPDRELAAGILAAATGILIYLARRRT